MTIELMPRLVPLLTGQMTKHIPVEVPVLLDHGQPRHSPCSRAAHMAGKSDPVGLTGVIVLVPSA